MAQHRWSRSVSKSVAEGRPPRSPGERAVSRGGQACDGPTCAVPASSLARGQERHEACRDAGVVRVWGQRRDVQSASEETPHDVPGGGKGCGRLPSTHGGGWGVPPAANPASLARVDRGGGAHRSARPFAVACEMPETIAAEAPSWPGAGRHQVLVGQAVQASTGEGGGDARRDRRRLALPLCPTLSTSST
jgi:hypothetical protein